MTVTRGYPSRIQDYLGCRGWAQVGITAGEASVQVCVARVNMKGLPPPAILLTVTAHTGGCHVKMTAEVEVVLPQSRAAKIARKPPEPIVEAWTRFFHTLRRNQYC